MRELSERLTARGWVIRGEFEANSRRIRGELAPGDARALWTAHQREWVEARPSIAYGFRMARSEKWWVRVRPLGRERHIWILTKYIEEYWRNLSISADRGGGEQSNSNRAQWGQQKHIARGSCLIQLCRSRQRHRFEVLRRGAIAPIGIGVGQLELTNHNQAN